MPKITEEELTAILDQIIIDVENLDYTAIYEMIEKLADLDSVIVSPLLRGFLSEAHRKAEDDSTRYTIIHKDEEVICQA